MMVDILTFAIAFAPAIAGLYTTCNKAERRAMKAAGRARNRDLWRSMSIRHDAGLL